MTKTIRQLSSGAARTPVATDSVETETSGNASGWSLLSAIQTLFDAATSTLTNKTISLTNNTLTGTAAEFNAAMSGDDFANLTGIATLTNKTLTTPTIASFTNATHTHQDAAGGGTLASAALATSPYVLQTSAASFNPADATTYYLGSLHGTTPTTTAGRRRVYVPRPGTATRIDLFINCATGTSETSTISFRLNDTTNTTISAVVNLSATPFIANVTGMSVAVVAGDFFEISWTTSTWVTDPTSVSISAQVYIS